jgi:hypothetical protein
MIPRSTLAIFLTTLVLGLTTADSKAADEYSPIVVGKNAPELDRYAADQLRAMLTRMFDLIPMTTLVGNPTTNQNIPKEAWPEITDQGIVIKAILHEGKPTLILGGGSPKATLWSVYELGHRFGIRYLLRGDIYPDKPTPLDFNNLNLVIEPNLPRRIWHLDYNSVAGPSSWPQADLERLLQQLAKKKFNHLQISIYPWQPFVHDEQQGVKKQTVTLWHDKQFPIPRDAPGRTAFGSAKIFENPDFAGKSSNEEMLEAGQTHLRGILAAAHRLGITVSLVISPLEISTEIAATSDTQLASAKIQAYLETYPNLDQLY